MHWGDYSMDLDCSAVAQQILDYSATDHVFYWQQPAYGSRRHVALQQNACAHCNRTAVVLADSPEDGTFGRARTCWTAAPSGIGLRLLPIANAAAVITRVAGVDFAWTLTLLGDVANWRGPRDLDHSRTEGLSLD